jgi:hypothetical protein
MVEKQYGADILKVPKDVKLFETAIATVWIDEYGIVCVKFKPVRRTLQNNKEYIEALAGFVKDGSKICLVVDITNTMPMRAEIREYLAAEYPKYVKAIAPISAKSLQGTIATTFQTISTGGYPMNLFSNETEAKDWLKTFLQAKIKAPNNTKLYETPIATFWLDKDGIVCGVSKPVERTVEHYKKNFELFAKLMKNGNKLCFLADSSNTLPVSLEVREYLTTEIPKYIKAHAIISDHPLPATLTTAVIKLSFAGFPVNQFLTEEEAKGWLKTFL